MNLSSRGFTPAPLRIECAPGVWADVAAGPATTVVEDYLEAEFEDLIRSGWPSAPAGPPFGTHSAEAPRPPLASAADSPPAAPEVPEGLLAQLDQLEAVTERITSADLSGLPGSLAAEVSQRVRRATDQLAAQRLVLIGQIEAEGSWRADTMHSFSSWLASRERLSKALAQRTVGAARALREHLPATAAAACAGEITAEHVSIMVKATGTETLREKLAGPVASDTAAGPVCTGEQMLLGNAG
ncbi:DUF222 domain-containing protein, partial [Sanguibacter gelidistatuariae]